MNTRSDRRGHRRHYLVAALAAALLIGYADRAVWADPITDSNVDAAMAAAKTLADHAALAVYFTAKAEAAAAMAEMHTNMAKSLSGKLQQNLALHCNALAGAYRQQAKDYTALAKEEAALAKEK